MEIVVVTRNYQITIPKRVRTKANIKEGDKVIIDFVNGNVLVKKIKEVDLETIFGSWEKTEITASFMRKLREEGEIRARRIYPSMKRKK